MDKISPQSKIFGIVVVITGLIGLIMPYTPFAGRWLYGNDDILVISLFLLGSIETIKRRQYLFATLFILVGLLAVIGVTADLLK